MVLFLQVVTAFLMAFVAGKLGVFFSGNSYCISSCVCAAKCRCFQWPVAAFPAAFVPPPVGVFLASCKCISSGICAPKHGCYFSESRHFQLHLNTEMSVFFLASHGSISSIFCARECGCVFFGVSLLHFQQHLYSQMWVFFAAFSAAYVPPNVCFKPKYVLILTTITKFYFVCKHNHSSTTAFCRNIKKQSFAKSCF